MNTAIKETLPKEEDFRVKVLNERIEVQDPEFLQKLCRFAENKDWGSFIGRTYGSDSEKRCPERLTALDVLLQGYLAINNKESFFNQGSPGETQEFLAKHGILQGERGN